MDPALAADLHRALEIGRAQAAHGAVAPLPLLVELLRLDDAIADAVLAAGSVARICRATA